MCPRGFLDEGSAGFRSLPGGSCAGYVVDYLSGGVAFLGARRRLPFGVVAVGVLGTGGVVANTSVPHVGRNVFPHGMVVLGHLVALANITVVRRHGKVLYPGLRLPLSRRMHMCRDLIRTV